MVGKRVHRIGPMTTTFLETGAHNILLYSELEFLNILWGIGTE
jgi:hypothetical protein